MTPSHSFFLLLALLLHACLFLLISSLAGNRKEITLAELDIGAVELNLSETPEESRPSPSVETSQTDPEPIPETSTDPEMKAPDPDSPEPEFHTIPLPEPAPVIIPDIPRERPALQEPLPPAVKAPRPEPPPPEEKRDPETTSRNQQLQEDRKDNMNAEGGAPSARIDQPPKPRQSIKPRYPAGARRRGEEGSVTLDVTINTAGRTLRASIAESSGFSELDEAAKRAVQEARFIPGRQNGENVESRARLTVIFKLR